MTDVREQRADARRNAAAILDAALVCLVRDPEANINDIARQARVGRVTVYGHFGSRAELVRSVFARTIEDFGRTLDTVELAGDPRAALARLVASCWPVVSRFRPLLRAARRIPGARTAHRETMDRIADFVRSGRIAGAFRSDLPLAWLVATFDTVVHGAADEVAAGRLASGDAARLITATVLAAYTPPGIPVPVVDQAL
jgi:TetR/AcrR family transcriptional repressor of mexCD-oprJ operon